MTKHSLKMTEEGCDINVNGEGQEPPTCEISMQTNGSTNIKNSESCEIKADKKIYLEVDGYSLTMMHSFCEIANTKGAVTLTDDTLLLKFGTSTISIQDGIINIASDQININANQTLSLESTDTLTSKAMTTTLASHTEMIIESFGTVEVNANGPAALKGLITSIG